MRNMKPKDRGFYFNPMRLLRIPRYPIWGNLDIDGDGIPDRFDCEPLNFWRQDNLDKNPIIVELSIPWEKHSVYYYKGYRFSFMRGGLSKKEAIKEAKKGAQHGTSTIIVYQGKDRGKDIWCIYQYIPLDQLSPELRKKREDAIRREAALRAGKVRPNREHDVVSFSKVGIKPITEGAGIDAHIASAIAQWNKVGLVTVSSCEGHEYESDGSVCEHPGGYITWVVSPYDRQIANLAVKMLPYRSDLDIKLSIRNPGKLPVSKIDYNMTHNFKEQKRAWIRFMYEVPKLVQRLKRGG